MDSNTTEPQSSLLSNPIVLGGIVRAVGVGVGGVLYFFVFGGGGAVGSAGGGSIIQNHPPSPSNGVASTNPSGTSSSLSEGFGQFDEQMSNITDINDFWSDFVQDPTEISPQLAIQLTTPHLTIQVVTDHRARLPKKVKAPTHSVTPKTLHRQFSKQWLRENNLPPKAWLKVHLVKKLTNITWNRQQILWKQSSRQIKIKPRQLMMQLTVASQGRRFCQKFYPFLLMKIITQPISVPYQTLTQSTLNLPV